MIFLSFVSGDLFFHSILVGTFFNHIVFISISNLFAGIFHRSSHSLPINVLERGVFFFVTGFYSAFVHNNEG